MIMVVFFVKTAILNDNAFNDDNGEILMRLSGLMLLAALSASAQAQTAEKDPYLDAAVSAQQVKVLQEHTDPAVKKVVTEAIAAEPRPQPLLQSEPAFSVAKSDIMTAAFNEAKVPDCLHSEGLKRQPTFFLSGYLALPFIAVAALRGVCN
ncbi:hypothetical protein GTP56_19705 [Duganella sp. FT134W]|uniref:Uncharacterized protein n=1 Tax=Duganella margarita TaxID=2692170 RepID=A0A7X4H4X6_9BURK|nr:hypothetical protein [Duganella margarita]MYM74402.1 hypothetical protein [Duganella margarita]